MNETNSTLKTILLSIGTSLVTSAIVLSIGLTSFSHSSYKNSSQTTPSSVTQTEQTPDTKNSQFTNNENAVIETAKRSNPAVVSIIISQEVASFNSSLFGSDPYEEFFNNPFFQRRRVATATPNTSKPEKKEVGGGSGFLVSADGLVVTNRHVVDLDNAEFTVLTNDGVRHPATIVAKDSILDIAILRIEGDSFAILDFADSDSIEVGQSVIAIGNALAEFRNTVSVGVISGLSRSILAGSQSTGSVEHLDEVIQTDAAINPGNSGGPLLDLSGKVVGVNVAVAQGSQNIGFALPANSVKSVVASVQATGRIIRPFVGIRYVAVTKTLQDKNDLPVDYGILVSKGATNEDLAVIPGSPADKAGILENDIILEVDGIQLSQDKSFASIIRRKSVGDSIVLKLLSKGDKKEVTVVLEEAKESN